VIICETGSSKDGHGIIVEISEATNRLTAIRVPAGTKNSHLVKFLW
jgi:hypothetical protein